MTETERQTYSFLDLLGDVGGLFDGFRYIVAPIIAPFAAFTMRSQVLTQAFRYKPEERDGSDDDQNKVSDPEDVVEGMITKNLIDRFKYNYLGLKRIKRQGCCESYLYQCLEGRRYRKLLGRAHRNLVSQLDLVKFF